MLAWCPGDRWRREEERKREEQKREEERRGEERRWKEKQLWMRMRKTDHCIPPLRPTPFQALMAVRGPHRNMWAFRSHGLHKHDHIGLLHGRGSEPTDSLGACEARWCVARTARSCLSPTMTVGASKSIGPAHFTDIKHLKQTLQPKAYPCLLPRVLTFFDVLCQYGFPTTNTSSPSSARVALT